jgi:dTDP-4-amino-4,6-dideoxygalactose transaminase
MSGTGEKMIPFNKPFLIGKELDYIAQTVENGHTSGNGPFTKRCQAFFEREYGFTKCLLTTSCTDALEMAALLADIRPGDEVIMPSFTFVSTALAFVRQGAAIIFADSGKDNPNMDADLIEPLITPLTKAIVPVHYAGVACDMRKILELAKRYNLLVIADSAQAVDSFYKADLSGVDYPWHKQLKRQGDLYPLGGLGHLGCFSFHETKNIQCGEGGMLTINDPRFIRRGEIIWEKGTNRADYFRGEVSKYEWVDIGSSFLPSGITAAFLWAQLEQLRKVQDKRKMLWELYNDGLRPLAEKGCLSLPKLPPYATNNAHMFYVICASSSERAQLLDYLAQKGVQAATHYHSLHDSTFYKDRHAGHTLVNCKRFVDCLLRLPLFYELEPDQVLRIVSHVKGFYDHHFACIAQASRRR